MDQKRLVVAAVAVGMLHLEAEEEAAQWRRRIRARRARMELRRQRRDAMLACLSSVVPKYLSQQWTNSAEREVGKLKIGKKNGRTEEVSFTLSKALSTLSSPGEKSETLQVPRDYPFTMHTAPGQNLAVFTQSHTDEIALEGVVVQRGECRPAATDNYMKLKKRFIEESIKPHRVSQQLEKAVTTVYKPVANHVVNVEYEKKRKAEGRMVRAERQVVLDMLFSAFEKHQYYNIKDLVDVTKQPVMYLKEIMREIGVYNTKGAHKSTWELKPEYSHYNQTGEKSDEEEAPKSTG